MAYRKDFWPTGRQEQLNKIKVWIDVLTEPSLVLGADSKPLQNWEAWGMSKELFTALKLWYGNCVSALDAVVLSGSRTGPLHTACNEAFAELEKLARQANKIVFNVPPLRPQDIAALLLKERDTVKTPPQDPRYAPLFEITHEDPHTIRVKIIRPTGVDQDCSKFSVIMRAGILRLDGTIPAQSEFSPWYMKAVPGSVLDLPKQKNANRKYEYLVFGSAESGSKVYLSFAFVNSRGEEGPWTDIVGVIIT